MNGKLNDIITLMQTALLSGSAVRRKRIPGGDIGRQPTTPKELFTPIQIVARKATCVTGSTGSVVSMGPLGSTGLPWSMGPPGSMVPLRQHGSTVSTGLVGPTGSKGSTGSMGSTVFVSPTESIGQI